MMIESTGFVECASVSVSHVGTIITLIHYIGAIRAYHRHVHT